MTLPFELSESKENLLKTDGHILALGGPGSGKTTIALLKARYIIESGLKKGQHVLFLSFARATVARVDQQAKIIVSEDIRKHLEINTYHGFCWTLLKSHGYLLRGGSSLKLLPPPEASARLAHIDQKLRSEEIEKLFLKEGLLHFDLFAKLSADLLNASNALASIIANAYPIIILDEFQDTNTDEWRLIQVLGKKSILIALADLDQRIYEFRGADPKRVSEFISLFKPTPFDFGKENNRSNGTDIVQFGNDLLTSANKGKTYNDVECKRYPVRTGLGLHLALKTEVLRACKRLNKSEQANWSLGILVPTKKLMLAVSDYLSKKQEISKTTLLPPLNHEVALEMAGPSLSAIVIAKLLEQGNSSSEIQYAFLNNLYEHIRGRNGNDQPSQKNIALADSLKEYISTGKIVGSNRKLIVGEAFRIAGICRTIKFTGDPAIDWVTVRKLLAESKSEAIQQVAFDAEFLRLLRKGTVLNSGLSSLWRNGLSYKGSSSLVGNALLQEHFSASTSVWKGIHVMTIHKAKGKEFHEVIIYEGMHQGKIVWSKCTQKEFEQARLALRVAVTRAMSRTTIVTPANDPCPFLHLT